MNPSEGVDLQHQHIKTARKERKRAKQQLSKATYDTPEYWKISQVILGLEDTIKDLIWQRRSETLSSEPHIFEQEKREYLRQKEEREERRQSAIRREERYKERSKVLSLSNNRATLRAAYVDLFLSVRGKTSRDNQNDFIESIKAAYGSKQLGNQTTYCNVLTGSWHVRQYFVAAHIFPLSYGQQAMDNIFGKDTHEEINTARNGLFLPSEFEPAFDAYQVVIVPHGPVTSQPREWQVILLDHSGLKEVPVCGMTFGQLHKMKLIFPTESRPRAKYLYFHFILGILSYYCPQKFMGGVDTELLDQLTIAWGSKGNYIVDDVIHGLLERVGHHIPMNLQQNMLNHGFRAFSETEADDIRNAAQGMDLRSDTGETDSDGSDSDDDFFDIDGWAIDNSFMSDDSGEE
ncbi:TPA_exp: Uncharacterized protein A8136_3847 [Trichophyton benhamiae CBS 112371]|uniref:HNH nuclease domain-containing protein n=1 Tax=Arthroderma benhamiae (strain ATCC MYA-4681 / CBS 112371) TaxID=663331 RepID=D4B1M9_ARTBC|nr:uncharacterized protein ARB_02358 [Trichophyton benhamiae CBS 112371]EFE30661.1 hypothetical protein ARB_02358 [Trichophyton benhamiae CBS 112371]DAA73861.1 TPA_exp: Uncharacterized protein A8136_3847 [Trichophyton benhamiae CBS 112371]